MILRQLGQQGDRAQPRGGLQQWDDILSPKAGKRIAPCPIRPWASLYRDASRPFHRPDTGRIAVKVINHFGDEVMKVFGV